MPLRTGTPSNPSVISYQNGSNRAGIFERDIIVRQRGADLDQRGEAE